MGGKPGRVETRPYYSDKGLSARFYDLTTAADQGLAGDIELYAVMVPAGGAVLELGSGTGRVALGLAARGLSVLGIELAPAMVAQAEAKRSAAPAPIAERIRFLRGDMADLRLSERFDAVVCPYFGLAHLPAGAAWRNVFAGVARHLKPGGRAAFHLPSAAMLSQPAPRPDAPVLKAALDAGRSLRIHIRERAARVAQGRYDQVVEYVVEGPRGIEAHSLDRMTYYVADPAPFARTAGLEPDGEPEPLAGGALHRFRWPG